MARDTQTPTTLAGGKTPGMVDYGTAYTWEPANNVEFLFTGEGREIVVIKNVTGGDAVVSLKVVPNAVTGRFTQSTVTIAAGDYGVVGAIGSDGFRQSDGMIYIDCDVAVEAIFLRIPR